MPTPLERQPLSQW